MASLPTGTITFFFTDIEGSTRLFEALGPEYPDLLDRHHQIVRDAISSHSGHEVSTEGDSFFAVFGSAADAVAAAVALQRGLAVAEWPGGTKLRVRVGLHTGEARLTGTTYVGLDVHRAARIMAAAHGGQILISETSRALAERSLSSEITLIDLGEHRLRDLSGRERLFQVLADGLGSEFPPPRTLEATPQNLLPPATELVGRESELREIRDHLGSPNVRLLTLTGPGGIGKTRLALSAAADAVDHMHGGVYFVDLVAARDAAGALQAMVQALRVTVPADGQPRAALAQQIGARRMLLLLDNFEQVIEAADEVADLLQHCPGLKVLVTSREALRIRGERLFPVAPLSQSDAMRLLVKRAREAGTNFALSDDNTDVVADICIRLDGLPLAIELAAARLKLFSASELRDRLARRLELLRGGARDLPPRQRTLRGTIQWSYELLDDDERAIFQLLALFSAARVESVEEVASTVGSLAGIDVVDRLTSLIDKSLVRSAVDAQGQRLSMLETIRDFALEALGNQPAMRREAQGAHAHYFAQFARDMRAGLDSGTQEGALEGLALELGNLQATWRFFVAAGDIAQLHTLLDALWVLYESRGWYHGAIALTNDLLGVLSKSPPAPDRADEEITLRLSLARGLLAIRGYTEEVEQLYRAALALSDAAGLLPKRLPVLRSLASFYLYRGEIDKSAAIGRELLELGEREKDPTLQMEGHLLLGPALAFMGSQGRVALDHLDRAIALFDPERDGRVRFRLGPSPGVAARSVSALLLWLYGHPVTAEARGASALELAAQLRHPYSLAYATFHVTLLDLWSRRLDVAHQRAGDVLDIADEYGYQIWRALGLVLQGVTTASLGDPQGGLMRSEQGMALYENLQTPPVFWPQLLGLRAEASQLAGRSADALELLDRAITLADGDWGSLGLVIQKADLLMSLNDIQGAERLLQRAFDEARAVDARAIQLRAATRLAQPPMSGGNALLRLREVYDTFTEGFDTPDLLDASALLAEAAASRR
jgi:predicted ATPase/class 3 adenylate cyclase